MKGPSSSAVVLFLHSKDAIWRDLYTLQRLCYQAVSKDFVPPQNTQFLKD